MGIAFFDFDGTLLVKDSRVLCAVPLVRAGFISPWLGVRIVWGLVGQRLGLVSRDAVYRTAFLIYKGYPEADVHRIVRDIDRDHLRPARSPAMLERVGAHRALGDRLVIATAAAAFLPAPLAHELGFDAVLGTQVGFEGGICTGAVVGSVLDGHTKRTHAEAYAAALGVPLADCTFYSDHILDLPLLEAVGKPVAVGPHAPLAKLALRRGWEILPHQPMLVA
jgi:putative phosphoserine phosphatase/1-acylglycerol-3-phosphate O-acyltransferase